MVPQANNECFKPGGNMVEVELSGCFILHHVNKWILHWLHLLYSLNLIFPWKMRFDLIRKNVTWIMGFYMHLTKSVHGGILVRKLKSSNF